MYHSVAKQWRVCSTVGLFFVGKATSSSCSFGTLRSCVFWGPLVVENEWSSRMQLVYICAVSVISVPPWFTLKNSWTWRDWDVWNFTTDEFEVKKVYMEMKFRCLYHTFLKAFSKYFTVIFKKFVLYFMYVPQKKAVNQTSPVSASKTQDNLRQPQLTNLLSNTLSGQLRSF